MSRRKKDETVGLFPHFWLKGLRGINNDLQ